MNSCKEKQFYQAASPVNGLAENDNDNDTLIRGPNHRLWIKKMIVSSSKPSKFANVIASLFSYAPETCPSVNIKLHRPFAAQRNDERKRRKFGRKRDRTNKGPRPVNICLGSRMRILRRSSQPCCKSMHPSELCLRFAACNPHVTQHNSSLYRRRNLDELSSCLAVGVGTRSSRSHRKYWMGRWVCKRKFRSVIC